MKLETILRKIRQHIFDMPEAKQEKATRLIGKIKARLMPHWEETALKRNRPHWMYACE